MQREQIVQLSEEQQNAMNTIVEEGNYFITGPAGAGKSFFVKYYITQLLKKYSKKEIVVLGSTGAAAILVGGRTFHSFFGLGIGQGTHEQIVSRAVDNKRVAWRLRKARVIIIDEVSMIPGQLLAASEHVARLVRETDQPWGGLKIICVGDFAQLPPVSQDYQKPWAFMHPVWQYSGFEPIIFDKSIRSEDAYFLEHLHQIRKGTFSQTTASFLDSLMEHEQKEFSTHLYARKNQVAAYNAAKLNEIDESSSFFTTVYQGNERYLEGFKRSLPIEDIIELKVGALVMIRINDPKMRYVNGTLARVVKTEPELLHLLTEKGQTIELEKVKFSLLNADAEIALTAENFPVSLAWASTIHKIQGATIDRIRVGIENLWEPGQAYVALSRVRKAEDIELISWDEKSLMADPMVMQFYDEGCPVDFSDRFEIF
ncbi:MAG TPA: AAA family ATPase [Oligoflexia bacterium]|nr:AAA family ATPase [Oligoflexia bacterium]HMR23839.1 AAA family ATPase [Oligoflexia bacterium]